MVSANDSSNDSLSMNSTDIDVFEEAEDVSNDEVISNVEDAVDISANADSQETLRNSSKISVVASSWDDIKTYAEKTDADYIINLEGKKYTIGSGDIQFKNNAEIIGTTGCFITGIVNTRIPFKSMENPNLNITFKNVLFSNINCDMLIQLQTNGISILENCTFKNVIAGQSKNSVVYNSLGLMNLTSCSFISSSAGYGVLSNYNPGTVKGVLMNVRNCYFENNYAKVEPGSINNCGILTVTNTTFRNNRAEWWAGAIHTHIGASTTIYDSNFIDNVAGWNGGALYTYSYLAIYNSTFIGNNCTTDTGGGAIGATYGDCAPDVYIEGCIFKDNTNNHLTGAGGAISITAKGKLQVVNTTFVHNSAANGTAIYADANEYGSPTIIVTGNTFINHTRFDDVLRVNLSGTDFIVANNTYINNAIPYANLYLDVSEVFDRKVNVTVNYSLKNPQYYEPDILNHCHYDVYIDGKYSKTIDTTQFTLNFEDIVNCKVYVSPSIYVGATPEVTIIVPRNYTFVSQSRGSDENDGLTSDTPVKTIAQAVRLAKSSENIILMDGVFNEENINVDYRLTIWGTSQSSIGGFDISNRIFNVTNAKFSLRNLTINGLGMMGDSSRLIMADSGSRIYLANCIVENNEINTLIESQLLGITDTEFNDNKLSIKVNNLTVVNSSFDNNTAYSNNGFLSSADAVDWNIVDSTFTNNKNGLMSYSSTSSTLKISNTVFENNTASSQASCIVIGDAARLDISSSKIRYNDENIAAIYKNGGGSVINIKDSIIFNSGIIMAGDTSNIDCNYNWWGNTLENKELRPNLNPEVQLDNWLFLSMDYPDEVEVDVNYIAQVTLDNLITKEGVVSTYDNYNLPVICFALNYNNITVDSDYFLLDCGKSDINFALNSINNGSLLAIYDDVAVTANFKFTKTDPVRQITVNDVLVGSDVNVEITLPDDLTGEITVSTANFTETRAITNNTLNFIINGLPADNYTVTVSYNGDNKYRSFEDEVNFTVNKYPSTTSISIGKVILNENVTVTVNVDDGATGNITLSVNGIEHNLTVTNSKATFTIENITVGDWIIEATYNGNDKYLPSTDYKKFSVGKNNVTADIDLKDIVFGQDAFLKIEMNSDATGNITVHVDDLILMSPLKNGKVNFTLSGLNAGDKKVQINYTGDGNYNEEVYNISFYIDKVRTQVNITATGAKEGKEVIVEISIPKGGNGRFTIDVEDIHDVVEIPLDGKVTWTTRDLKAGEHTIHVAYSGNNYYNCQNSTDVVVLPWDEPQWPNDRYDSSGKSPYESSVNGEIKWSVNVGDIVSGNIVIDCEGNIYIITSNGIYSFDNTGKARWNYSSRSNMFSGLAISRDVVISPISGDTLYLINQTTGERYGANIWQASSAFMPITDKNANIYVAGDKNEDNNHYSLVIVPYYTWKNGNGVISIDLGTSKPTTAPVLVSDNVVAIATEDGLKVINIKDKSVISTLNIITDVRPIVGDANIVYAVADGKIYAIDSMGNQLWSSASSIEDAKYLAIDNDKNVLYALDFKNNLYKYDLLDSGKETLFSNEITSGIMIGNDGIIYAGMGTALAALNSDGKFLWKSETGDEIVSTPAMDKDGIIYAIGSNNLFAFGVGSLKDFNLTMTTENMYYGGDAKLILTFANDATGNISVVINGKEYSGDVRDGRFEISLPKLNAGEYPVEINYSGDKRYLASELTKSFNINKIDIPNFSLDIPDVLYDDNPTFSYNFPADVKGRLTVSVDGNSYSSEIVNGYASVTIPKLKTGTHNIVVSYSGDQNYNPIENTKSVVIYPIKITDNHDLTMDYNTGYKYSIRVWGSDGKVVVGASVKFVINKKSYTVKTDKNGYASLVIKELPKKYTITASYEGVVVKNVIKVKRILKASNVVVKKSAKKFVLKAILKLSNGKAVKNKVIKFKFKGKTYKAKTNKKGIAKVTIKKKVIKKLKKGKKYTFKVTYIKDTIKKTVKVKK